MYSTILMSLAGAFSGDVDNPFDDVEPSTAALGTEFVSLQARALGAFWWVALAFSAFCMIYAIMKFTVGSQQSSPHEVNKGKKALVGALVGVIMLVGLPLWMDVAINFIG